MGLISRNGAQSGADDDAAQHGHGPVDQLVGFAVDDVVVVDDGAQPPPAVVGQPPEERVVARRHDVVIVAGRRRRPSAGRSSDGRSAPGRRQVGPAQAARKDPLAGPLFIPYPIHLPLNLIKQI